MLTISKPLSASQAQAYHAEEFGNARENYYTQGDQIRGEWHGRLAEQWGLKGEVREEHFQRLSEGQHPVTGEQLVRHKAAREGVTIYRETERSFAQGDRIQFTAPNREQHVANRELGTIEKIDASGDLRTPSTQAAPLRSTSERIRILTLDMP